MFKLGSNVVLKQSIIGKKQEFPEGLQGSIIEILDYPSGKSFRVQFIDGRVGRFPTHIMEKAIKVLD